MHCGSDGLREWPWQARCYGNLQMFCLLQVSKDGITCCFAMCKLMGASQHILNEVVMRPR